MPLGIYIQVPFCQTKCTYCNFHTGVVSPDRYEPYANAICREITLTSDQGDVAAAFRPANSAPTSNAPTPVIDTIYFGGGTPSLLAPSALAKILNTLHQEFQFGQHSHSPTTPPTRHSERSEEPAFSFPEITLEADPETVTPAKSTAWRSAGFNRVSLGAQSFNDRELQATGRMHRRADIESASRILRASGFDNISMDLIAGLPHQTPESWEESVTEIIRLRPEHISIYMLEIDEGSHLGKESLAGGIRYSAPAIPPDDAQADFYDSACARLFAAGYDHHEISNWALPNRRSRHNLKYWQRAPYLGLGAGAHSFNGTTRWANLHDSARYVSAIEQGTTPREQIEKVTSDQALEEEFFLGLRQLQGIDLTRIEREYSSNGNGTTARYAANGTVTAARFAAIRSKIETLRTQGLLNLENGRLTLSPNHLTISSSVLAELLT